MTQEQLSRFRGFGFRGLGFRGITPIMENQMDKKMENEMETRIIWGLVG